MRLVALFLLLMSVVASGLAQNMPKQKSAAKTFPAEDKRSKPWEPAPFILEGDRLPSGYVGLDSKRFLQLFRSKIEGATRGEFETSAEFQRRNPGIDAQLSPISLSALYAFRMQGIETKYDPDAQVYSVTNSSAYAFARVSSPDANEFVICRMSEVSRKVDTYIGANSFGATQRVERTHGHDFAVAIRKSSPVLFGRVSPSDYQGDNCKYRGEFRVAVEKARGLKNLNIAMLFVGRVTEPRIIKGRTTLLDPKIGAPYDIFITEDAIPMDLERIVYYVVQTGEVLAQQSL